MHVLNLMKWIGNFIIWTFIQTFIVPVRGNNEDFEYDITVLPTSAPCADDDDEHNDQLNRTPIITRTRLYSCDQVIRLYTLSPLIKNKTSTNRVQSCER